MADGPSPGPHRPRVAVLGAGITGLAAAWELERGGADVVVFDPDPVAGGKLRQSDVDELAFPLDDGADAFLARVPDALELCDELGIDDLVHPATGRASVFARRELRPLPASHLLGVPTDLDELAATGLVSDEGIEWARADLASTAAPPTEDVAVGRLIRDRLGDEVLEHLVEPLIGGINAGEADRLSTAAVAPQIWACAQAGGSLLRAATEARARAVATGTPVFATPAAGMAELPRRLAERLSAELRLGTPAPPLTVDGTRVHVGPEDFDATVVAAPADAAAAILTATAPVAAARLRSIEFASVVMVTLVFAADRIDHPLDGSGFVVARTTDTPITACSWGSSKWAHWDDGEHVVLRVSIGHDADPADWCSMTDDELVAAAREGLRTTMQLDAEPDGTRVGRWARSFPQYRPGHLDLVASIHGEVADAGPIAVAGASLGGIGVPACIRQGREAARRLLG